MLRLLLRVLAVPVLVLIAGAIWLHGADGPRTPSERAHPSRPAPQPAPPAPTDAALPAVPSPSPQGVFDMGGISRLGPELWQRLNADARTNSTREWGMLEELSEAIRRQVEHLARRQGVPQ